jgi:hypothetical protein
MDGNNVFWSSAIDANAGDSVRVLMETGLYNPHVLYEYFDQALEQGKDKVVEALLESPIIDPTFNFNEPITVAGGNGHLDTVKVLLRDPRISLDARTETSSSQIYPYKYWNYGPIMAAVLGKHEDVLEVLLADERAAKLQPNLFAHIFYLAVNEVGDDSINQILVKSGFIPDEFLQKMGGRNKYL